jgi:hypothetical protein
VVYVIAETGFGYVGVSNYESGSFNEDCNQSENGNGSNSGGSVGLAGQPGTQVPLPIACGIATGDHFDSTGRDGCYLPKSSLNEHPPLAASDRSHTQGVNL